MSPSSQSDVSSDTEDEIVFQLRAHGISEAAVTKYKRANKRIEKRSRKTRITGDFCTICEQLTIEHLRIGLRISDSFYNLKESARACKLCHLVLTSLRNKSRDIDGILADDTVSTYKVGFNENGGTDTGIRRSDIVKVRRAHLDEVFWLTMDHNSRGVIIVEAQFSLNKKGLFHIHSLIRIFTKSCELSHNLYSPSHVRR